MDLLKARVAADKHETPIVFYFPKYSGEITISNENNVLAKSLSEKESIGVFIYTGKDSHVLDNDFDSKWYQQRVEFADRQRVHKYITDALKVMGDDFLAFESLATA